MTKIKNILTSLFSESQISQYQDLTDIYPEGRTKIWYLSPSNIELQRELTLGVDWVKKKTPELLPTKKTYQKSHILLGAVQETNPDKIYEMFQAENWSPNGEAKNLIRSLKLSHTSMSTGDIIELFNGRLFMVSDIGFYEIK